VDLKDETPGAVPPGPPSPEEMPAVLAIDGGNSKTDIALIAADGSVVATVRGPGSGAPNASTLAPMVEEVARRAGLRAGPDGSAPVARHITACLANVDLPEEEERLSAELAQRGWSHTSQVLNDTFALLRSGTHRPWGVAVVCGAGVNCAGVGPDGRIARFLALGHHTGDWGGGHWLGNEIMYSAMRAEDGRGPQTQLRQRVAEYFGKPTVHDVAVAVHVGSVSPEDLVQLTRVLLEAADSGDAVAVALVERQAEEVFLMARSVLERLDLAGTDVEVVLGGGILATRHPLLTAGVETRLKEYAPEALPCYTDIPPVAGAALLGLDHLGAPQAALDQLRVCYRGDVR